MVRLGLSIVVFASISGIVFQFHYGAIGTWEFDSDPATMIEFQFHYGAIGTMEFRIWDLGFRIFQFHYGAIGTYGRVIDFDNRCDFNSIMVRLGHKEYLIKDFISFISIPLWCDWDLEPYL